MERGERRENSIKEESGERRENSIKEESGERRENSREGRGRPPCLTAYLGCMGVQVARCCSGRRPPPAPPKEGSNRVCPYGSVGGTIATRTAILSPLSTLHSPL